MGATSYYRPKGQTDLDHFRGELIGTQNPDGRVADDGVRHQLIDGASYRGVFYGAYRETHPDGRQVVSAVICQFSWAPRSQYNFTVKTMSEASGPAACQCPQRILDLLSPIEEVFPGADLSVSGGAQYAHQWRERCRETLAARARRPKLTSGVVIRTAEPVRFTSGDEVSEFVFVSERRRRRFYSAHRQTVHVTGPDGQPVRDADNGGYVIAGERWARGDQRYLIDGHIRQAQFEIIGKLGETATADKVTA